MGKIGIITFHAAYNFGSVLQAYATQRAVDKLGYNCEIINYRLKNQKEYYNNLYSFKFGFKRGVVSLCRIKDHGKRKKRAKKFEYFISHQLITTKKEYNLYSELTEIKKEYVVLISGSDQIWNSNCPAEFLTEPAESILGYYLGFAGSGVKKISYASSTGDMSDEQMKKYVGYLNQYDFISVREPKSAEMLKKMLNCPVSVVLDPTFLLNQDEWRALTSDGPDENYILFYSLGRPHSTNCKIEDVKNFADRYGLKVYAITPFCSVKVSEVVELVDAGPMDFLKYVSNANLIITDSFHGTAFSVNLNVPFYAISRDLRGRIGQMLMRMNCIDRMLDSTKKLEFINNYSYDFTAANRALKRELTISFDFLKYAIFSSIS